MSKKIKVYYCNANGFYEKFLNEMNHNILSSDDTKVYQKLKNDKRREQFLFSRFLLNFILAKDWNSGSLYIKRYKSGKPYIKNLKFNISHSDKYFAIVVSTGSEVGIDIEMGNSRSNWIDIAKNYFNDFEKQYIFPQSESVIVDDDAKKRFLKLWALKESFVKALDQGIVNLNVNPNNLTFVLPLELNKIKLNLFYHNDLDLALSVIGPTGMSEISNYVVNCTGNEFNMVEDSFLWEEWNKAVLPKNQ